MIRFYKNNKGGFFAHIFIFVLFLFYILSSAVNILLFHFVLDVNLAKVGMLLVIVVLGILVRRDFWPALGKSQVTANHHHLQVTLSDSEQLFGCNTRDFIQTDIPSVRRVDDCPRDWFVIAPTR